MATTVDAYDWMSIVGTPEEVALDAWLKATAGFDSSERLIRDADYEHGTLTLHVLIDPPKADGDEFAVETLTFTAPHPPPIWPAGARR